jgi:monovalent cation:H+ antiporter-2, CPA2 family
MSLEPVLNEFFFIMLVALAGLLVFYWFKQPSAVAYIIAGIAIGPFGLHLISNTDLISVLGELGVILLLFFIGMQVPLKSLVENWRVVILGTILQIAASVGFMTLLGLFFDWPIARIVLLGFVISLSSTAVILKFLESRNLIHTKIGKDVIGILLAQDLLVIPMLITLSTLGGTFEISTLILQIAGMVLLGALLLIVVKRHFSLPKMFHTLASDDDYKLLFALVFCFGVGLVAGMFHLSIGMGAFIGGMLASNIKDLDWMRDELRGFKTLFLALFFISIGLLIDISFLIENYLLIFAMLGFVFLTNTFINAGVFIWLKCPWQYSIYIGAILAQLGEFSFVLASAGFQIGAISNFGYQATISIIALSLLVSPLWIGIFHKFGIAPNQY